MLSVLDLFSGIGGFSLGLEKTGGFETKAFCEIDKNARLVLKKHWPNTPIYKDIRDLSFNLGEFDVLAGGFPCQDISVGGKQKGIKGERSGLWKEYFRLIKEIRPKYAIVENVERLRKNGLGVVLEDLSSVGYNATWHCITARAIGLPHQRDRLWLIAYSGGVGLYEYLREIGQIQVNEKWTSEEIYSERKKRLSKLISFCSFLSRGEIDDKYDSLSDYRASLSRVRRVTNGVSQGVDERIRKQRIKQLGNSVVPQIPELIGKAILKREAIL